jgi:hypothetical protein
MTYNTSQFFESYVPVYDAIPDDSKKLREFLVEVLKEHSNAINIRAIGWMLDEELLSGFQFIPPAIVSAESNQFRTVLRKVIDVGPLFAGANSKPHGILFDANFTLIDLWVSATQSTGILRAQNINPNDVYLDTINININSPQAFNRAFAQVLYIQEL